MLFKTTANWLFNDIDSSIKSNFGASVFPSDYCRKIYKEIYIYIYYIIFIIYIYICIHIYVYDKNNIK